MIRTTLNELENRFAETLIITNSYAFIRAQRWQAHQEAHRAADSAPPSTGLGNLSWEENPGTADSRFAIWPID